MAESRQREMEVTMAETVRTLVSPLSKRLSGSRSPPPSVVRGPRAALFRRARAARESISGPVHRFLPPFAARER
ncbi:hypothetical protein J5N97_010287 [Dioscorea zingiberensis]|uniref:Uncharacterized protein n=1 Tax=Dioscorea zingiberensis TaxID=325984 RepID=A0A9D5D0D4_9LILI|nr:hypothetical protein J5N97_010287 [Dioscorea zingiberensis]